MKRLVRGLSLVVAVLVALAVPVLTAAPAHAAGDFRFVEADITASEGQAFVHVLVERADLPVSRTSVDFRTEAATATPGSDYRDTFGTLTFGVGESRAAFTVFLRDDAVAEPVETVTLRLANASSSSIELTIEDDDVHLDTASTDTAALAAPDEPATPDASAVARAATAASGVRPQVRSAAGAPRRPAAVVRRPPTAPRRVEVRQSAVTPFELRPAPRGALAPSEPGDVDAGLAVLAALVLARVAAEIWFRSRDLPT